VRIIRRVLVTGSRAWKDARPIVWAALDLELQETPPEEDLEILQGGAAGPDRDAEAWVNDYIARFDPTRFAGVTSRRFDPDYKTYYANVAPFIRNQVMVDERPSKCLAFHWGLSTGTGDCIDRALKAGILTHIYRPGQTDPEIIAPLF
jgi:hypothetical protein